MKRLLFFIVLVALSLGVRLNAQNTEYYNLQQLPDAGIYLPAPPDTSSLLFADDFNQWVWGKSMRATQRGRQASWESYFGIERMATVFGEAMGFVISKEKTPAIWHFMLRVGETGHKAVTLAKRKYMRKRPFARMNEHVAGEFDNEEELRGNGSYPSGHTALGWTTALALAEMAPELQDTILRRGFEYGQSRVIVGAHWQSDVDAARLASSAAMARMHLHPDYNKDLDAARREFLQCYRGPRSETVVFPDSRRILDAPFDTASRRYYADINAHWLAKAERATVRGSQAIADADNSIDAMLLCFAQSMGVALSREQTPQIYAMLDYARKTLVAQSEAVNNNVFRKRPYVQLAETTLIPQQENQYRGTSSYVSAHAAIGWGLSLLLAEINPDHQNAILQRGFEYGYSRVIAGYEYASDVQAARLMASYAVGRLHATDYFRTLVANALSEYNQLAGKAPKPQPARKGKRRK